MAIDVRSAATPEWKLFGARKKNHSSMCFTTAESPPLTSLILSTYTPANGNHPKSLLRNHAGNEHSDHCSRENLMCESGLNTFPT